MSEAGRAAWLPYLLWDSLLVLLIVVVWQAGKYSSSAAGDGPTGALPFALGGQPDGIDRSPATDIANMSPRERASRLYDRIMRYAEEGKTDSVRFFAPMALGSFEMLGAELDNDARYDYGRVASESGDLTIAAAQADTILLQSPDHLLGLALAARTASIGGDSAVASARWKRFLSVRQSELARNLPEYLMHASDIEQATKLAQGWNRNSAGSWP